MEVKFTGQWRSDDELDASEEGTSEDGDGSVARGMKEMKIRSVCK